MSVRCSSPRSLGPRGSKTAPICNVGPRIPRANLDFATGPAVYHPPVLALIPLHRHNKVHREAPRLCVDFFLLLSLQGQRSGLGQRVLVSLGSGSTYPGLPGAGWPWPLAQLHGRELRVSAAPTLLAFFERSSHEHRGVSAPRPPPGQGTAARPYGARRESRPSPGNASRPPAMALAGRRSGSGGGGAAGPAVSVAAAGPGPGSAGAPPGAAGGARGTASSGSVVRLCGRRPMGERLPRLTGCRQVSGDLGFGVFVGMEDPSGFGGVCG